MIRQLNKDDNAILMELVKGESEINLFIIGDVENYGYSSEFQKLWGEFNEKRELTAVLLKYFSNFVFYSRDSFFVEGFYSILESENFKMLSGESSTIEKFEKLHDFTRKKKFYFCKLDKPVNYDNDELLKRVRKVEIENLDCTVTDMINLYSTITEFENTEYNELKKKFVDKTGRGYYMEEKGIMVATAQTTAENSTSAMVVGVCTHPDFRHQGYASACMVKLCTDLLAEGRGLCLFYNNPEAAKIYKKLGFEDIGKWSMYTP